MALQVGELFVKLNLDSSDFSNLLNKARADLQDLARAKINLSAKIAIDKSGITEAKSATESLNTSLRSVQSEASNTSQSFFNLGNVIKGSLAYFAGTAIVNGMRSITDGLASVIPTAANFQQQMSAVKAVTDLTGISFQDLQQKALDLGAKTQYSASEAASAMEMLAKNGLTGTQILNGGIDTALAFAAATGTNLTQAADVASTAMLQFNLKASEMPSAVNAMTGAINASRMGVNDLRLAMANGGGIANQYGLSLQDFNTTIAATINQFSGGSDAGTGFKTFLLSLIPSTNAAKTAFQELGFIAADGTNQFFKANGELKSMSDVFALVREKMGSLSPAMQEMYGKVMFGQDGIRIMNGMLQTSAEEWTNLSNTISNTDAAGQAAIRIDNLNGVIEGIRGSFETLAITIGSTALPGLQEFGQSVIGIINTATTLVQALSGSQDAFNQLSPALQVAVVMVQDVMDYFSSLASAAMGWGQNIGSSFASGIIDAASAVIDALMEMGSWIEYWLAPGSPPRVAPDLDVWGKEVAEVYFNAFGDADTSTMQKSMSSLLEESLSLDSLQGLKDMVSVIKGYMSSLFDDSTESRVSVLESVIGTKQAIQDALDEFKKTGTVSEETYKKIQEAAGKAGKTIEEYVRAYIKQQEASEKLAAAQEKLYKAQKKVSDLEKAKDAESKQYQQELDSLERKQAIADIDAEIAEQEKLANAVGGDGSVQEAARQKIKELYYKKQLLLIEEKYQASIDQAKEEEKQAEEEAKAAEEEKKRADEQTALEEARIEAMQEQNDLIKEQIAAMKQLVEEQKKANEEKAKEEEDKKKKEEEEKKTTKKGAGGGRGNQEDKTAEKNAKAQEKYNYEIADTAGKLEILRSKLASVEEGSAEYYQILGNIHDLEEQQAKEQQQTLEEEQKEKEKATQAQKDYEYSVASTGDKLKILKQRLGEVKEGSAEYYEILKQIDSVQKQYDSEQEKDTENTGGTKKSSGGSAGSGAGVTKNAESALKSFGETAKSVRENVNAAKEKLQEMKDKVVEFRDNMDAAKRKIAEFTAPIATIAGNLKDLLLPAFAALATPSILAAIGSIGSVLAGLVSPIGILSLAVGALVLAWQNNFMNIQGYTQQAVSKIQELFTAFTTIASEIWTKHGDEIMNRVQTMWNTVKDIVGSVLLIIGDLFTQFVSFVTEHQDQIRDIIFQSWDAISGIVSGVLTTIKGVIQVALSVIRGDWEGVWNGIKTIFEGIWNAIVSLITGVLANIATVFGTNLSTWQTQFQTWMSNIQENWNTFWSNIYTTASKIIVTVLQLVSDRLTELKTNWDTFISNAETAWDTFWSTAYTAASTTATNVKNGVTTKIGELLTNITTFISNAKTAWDTFWGNIVDKAKTEIRNVVTKVTTELGNVKDKFTEITGSIISEWQTKLQELPTKIQTELNNAKNAVTGIIGEMTAAAKGIGDGIINGIKQGISAGIAGIKEAAKAAAQAAIDAAKSALNIQSPSRIFMEIGNNTSLGMALGITDKLGDVQKAMTDLVQIPNISVGNMDYALAGTMASAVPQNSAASITNFTFNIDARGSTMTEEQYKNIARAEISKQVQEGVNRRR